MDLIKKIEKLGLKERTKKLLLGMEFEYTCPNCNNEVAAKVEKGLILHCPQCGFKRKVNPDEIVKTDPF